MSPIRSLKVETEKPKTSAEISETELTASAQFVLMLRTAAFAAGMVYRGAVKCEKDRCEDRVEV